MPARLVYAPKAFVFTKNSQKQILNLTDYVTAGQVNRVVDQASTARVTLRNPNRMFTIPKSPTFLPMDPITIWLQRLPGFPVQVFTGYLDDTPYYQMYPGTVTLSATCTLKRLVYSYFDPSLPSVNTFLTKYGWINTGTGQALSIQGLANQATVAQGKVDSLVDGGLAKLLWATLVDFGDWKDSNIWIENLPTGDTGIARRMAKLIAEDATITSDQMQSFTQFMEQVIGAGSQGSGAGAGGSVQAGTPTGNVTDTPTIVRDMVSIANQHGLPSQFVLCTWYCEGQQTGSDPANFAHAVGYFQFTSADPYPGIHVNYPNDARDLGLATNDFCNAAVNYAKLHKVNMNDTGGWQSWAEGTQQPGTGAYNNTWAAGMRQSAQWISQYGGGANATTASATPSNPGGGTSPPAGVPYFPFPQGSGYADQSRWTPDQGVDISAPGNTPELAIGAGTVIKHGIGGFGDWAPVLKLDTPIQGQSYVYYGHAGPVGLVPDNTHVNAGQQITSVFDGIAGISTGPHLEIGFCDANGTPVPGTSGLMMSTLQAAIKGTTVPGGGTAVATAGQPDNILSTAKAVAFSGQLQLPTIEDMTTAIILGQYKRGLMHDQQLMPFVQQVANASLRHFQSLPNGDFFAFYPDYFGETGHRKPYWVIDDLELLQGDIYLNDSTLVTHEYAVGDNLYPVNMELLNELSSAGVITIFNAFLQRDLLAQQDPSQAAAANGGLSDVMSRSDAINFLKRYGVRPKVDNYPQIRSQLFEMFMAYQNFMLAWAGQFRSPFSFTFMPELFPGGKVAFSGQGVAMYINSVTHSWDYAEGFTTDAELMAPQKWGDNPDLPPNMVQALVGAVSS